MSRVRSNRLTEFTEGAGVTIDDPRFASGPWIDVTSADYDADTSGSADATAIIQEALDAVEAAGGGTVWLPPGTYKLQTSALTVGADVWLRGAGHACTHIKQFTTTVDAIQLNGARARLTDCMVSYNAAASTGTYAVKIVDADRCRIIDVVTFSNAARALGVIATSAGSGCTRNILQRFIVGAAVSEYGVVLSGNASDKRVLDTILDTCHFSSATLAGALLEDWVQGSQFRGRCIFDFCVRGVHINATALDRTFDTFFEGTIIDATTTSENIRAKNTRGLNIDNAWLGAVPASVYGVHLEDTVTRCHIHTSKLAGRESAGAYLGAVFIDGETSQVKACEFIQGAVAPATGMVVLGANSQFNDVALNTFEGTTAGVTVVDSGANNRIGPNFGDGFGVEARYAMRVNTTEHYRVDGVQVVGPQGAAIADATDAGSAITQLNLALARLREHGLIAT